MGLQEGKENFSFPGCSFYTENATTSFSKQHSEGLTMVVPRRSNSITMCCTEPGTDARECGLLEAATVQREQASEISSRDVSEKRDIKHKRSMQEESSALSGNTIMNEAARSSCR